VSSSDRTVKRQQIEDSTAARLAEIVAAAEQAAKQVIDQAETEARARLSDANEEADRIVAERLLTLAALTDEIGAQAEALKRGAEALQAAIVRAKLEIGDTEGFGGSAPMRRVEPEADGQNPVAPSLTVVGAPDPQPAPEPEPAPDLQPAADREAAPDLQSAADRAPTPTPEAPAATENFDSEPPPRIGNPSGARLLATQMAVSGSSRGEIEARLRSGFAITDTRPILDAILGPER
jgi:vacuolar-type H+-ATPase subunit H